MTSTNINFLHSQASMTLSGPGPYGAGGRKKRSLTTDEAGKQITRDNLHFRDINRDKKIDLHYTVDRSFNPEQQRRVRDAVQSWQDVANINFREQPGGEDGTLNIYNNPNGDRGVAISPHSGVTRTTATIGTQGGGRASHLGSYFAVTTVHEIGHALGLNHPGNYNGGNDDYNANASYTQDTKARTVMSYFSENNQRGHDFQGMNPSAPMMDDIAGMQRLYGANHRTRDTDTTYGFNSNTEREVMSLKSARDKPVFCVWDGGGKDTLDFSGFSQSQKINLASESFSDVGGLKGNVSIAKGATIENAIGGAGRDVLIGNEVDNRLTGGAGADQLRGGGGADTFVYARASDSTSQNPDMIEDFTSGTDKIDVSGALKAAGVKALAFTDRFSGRAGEAMIKHDSRTGQSSLAIDLKGTGNADFLVKSKGEIKATDVLSGGSVPDVNVPKPAPSPDVTPDKPDADVPKPAPLPEVTPDKPEVLIEKFVRVFAAFLLQLMQLFAPSPSPAPTTGPAPTAKPRP